MSKFPKPLIQSSLGVGDLPGAEQLVTEAGWNQTDSDWNLFRALGYAQCLKDPGENSGGQLAATSAILPYEHGVGWISMILVGSQWRRRGIATALLEECIVELQRRGCNAGLDATPAGRAVYLRLGFQDHWSLTRWRCVTRVPTTNATGQVRALEEEDWPQLAALDRESFGCDRTSLLRRLWDRSRGFACVSETGGGINGFLVGRDGRVATQLGPIAADDGAIATRLVSYAMQRLETPILIDTLDRHGQFTAWLTEQGFEQERPFTRMILGDQMPPGDPQGIFAIAGPELG